MSDLAGPVNQSGSGFLVPARNALSIFLGAFGHLGDVRMRVSSVSVVPGAYGAKFRSHAPLIHIFDQYNAIYMVQCVE